MDNASAMRVQLFLLSCRYVVMVQSLQRWHFLMVRPGPMALNPALVAYLVVFARTVEPSFLLYQTNPIHPYAYACNHSYYYRMAVARLAP